ncbi:Metallo-dependent phosphatase [Byssothecium circinans]|uniref:Metallo-dependent phosphatase n=1 Tax=Byssothecium circinans TaxID=147558 RepID=A0A6A5TN15_9PLEO|nr:Metallo-dependent phosphatase [Byssothecium circinans]
MKVSTTAALALTASGLALAEDVLYSQRLQKRGIDAQGHYNISFFHVNDVHAHLDEYSSSGTDCTRPERGCFGGYARIKTVIDEQRAKYEDSLWLNVGDEFQGTLFYSYYGGEKIAQTLNQLGFDAMTLGNHEFDGGDDKLGDFLANLTNIPIVSANIHSTNPKLNKTIKPYHIFPDKELAIIGVTTDTTPGISKPGKETTFSNAVEAVQNAIDEIRSTTNITRIAAITHIGYDKDQELAAAVSGLQLIMGGHSHTLLGDMAGAAGKYPTIVKNKDGDEVFIVTAYRWGEYVGYIDVTYDENGKILAYHGAPQHLTNTTKQDEGLQAQIDEWRKPFEEFAAEVLGSTNVELDQTTCQQKECLLGDFMADAMYEYRKNASENVAFAIINAGGVRATIDVGDITRGEVLTSFPFGNAIVELTLSGADLWDVLEGILSKVNVVNGKAVTSFLQVSKGIKIEYNPANTNGTKLTAVTIGNSPLDKAKEYQFVTLDFLATGGDNFFQPTTNFITLDTQDEVLTEYIKVKTPVDIKLDGRIQIVNGTAGPSSSSTAGPSSTLTSTPGVSGGTSLPSPTGTVLPPYPTGSSASRSVGTSLSYGQGTGVPYPTISVSKHGYSTAGASSAVYSTGIAPSSSTAAPPSYSTGLAPSYSSAFQWPSASSSSSSTCSTASPTPGQPVPSTSGKPHPSTTSVPGGIYSTVTASSVKPSSTPAIPSSSKPVSSVYYSVPSFSISLSSTSVPSVSSAPSAPYGTASASSVNPSSKPSVPSSGIPSYNAPPVGTANTPSKPSVPSSGTPSYNVPPASTAKPILPATTGVLHSTAPINGTAPHYPVATATATGTGVGGDKPNTTSPGLTEFTGAAERSFVGPLGAMAAVGVALVAGLVVLWGAL